jgi:hypothetical protein
MSIDMKLHRLQEATKSWTRKIKRIRRRANRKEPQPRVEDDVTKTSSSDQSTCGSPDTERSPSNEIPDQPSGNTSIPEEFLSELPFHNEDEITNEVDQKPSPEFTLFPNLPIELRNKIWEHACFLPRNLEVKSWNYGKRIAIPTLDTNEENPWQVWIYRSNTVPPAVLSVCLESRTIGLKYYKLDWGTHYAFRGFTFSTPATIYVNYDSDRIVMTQRFHSRDIEDCVDFLDRCFHKARYIALNVKDKGQRQECDYIRPFLNRVMENHKDTTLEDIILFSKKHSTNWPGKHIDFKMPAKGWTKSDDDCLIVLKRTHLWTNKGLLGRRRGKVKEELKNAPKVHFRRLSQGTKRY